MKEKPFIHCFRTYNCCYFYDFNTNAIVRIPESVYVHLQHLEKGTANISECDADVNEILNRLTEQGFLSSHHWCKIEHPASRLLENYLEGSVQSLTLQVTQQCNLKCEYCPYSGGFYNRQHNNRKMSFEIAKKAIDFYFLHSFDIPDAQIGFYGGEPLIEFEMIRRIVEYCNNEYYGKKIRYFVTTNATLLTEEKMTGMNNRETFLKTEPEMDITQFAKTELDLVYADESPNQILDVFYPEDGEGPYPLVIVFHGGAFAAGHKRTHYIKSMCLPVTQGYAVATVEYRLLQEAKWPAQLIDGKAAIRYLRANAEKLNLDPDRFAVWGNSAGGTVTQLLAVTADEEDMDDLNVGVKASSKIDCAIAWYTISELCSAEQFGTDIYEVRKQTGAGKGMMPGDGESNDSMFTMLLGYNPLYYPERTSKVSPISHVKESCPPMLIQHGTNDLVIDYHQSVYMAEKVKAVCGEDRVELDLFENEPHGSQVIKADQNIEKCIDFLDKHFYEGKNPYRKPLGKIRIVGENEDK